MDAKAPPPTKPAPLKGDLTNGPIFKTLLFFAIPTLLSSGLQSMNGTVNAIWVGRLIGEEALAATANANIIMFLMSSTAFGFGMAGTVKIGQHYGARNLDAARRTMGTAIGFCFVIMTALAALGWLFTPQLLDMMGTPGKAYGLALDYLRMLFISMPLVMASIILTMCLRGAGDSRTPLIFMGLTVALDILLNPLLITGWGPFPELGIVGSALAMGIASVISFVVMLFYIYAKDLPLRLRGAELAYLKPTRAELDYIVGKGIPMGAQMLLMSAAGIVMVGLVNREGMMTAAAYGAAMQLFTYIQMPAMAIGGAVSAMAAQYIGASRWTTLDTVTKAGVIINFALTGIVTVLLIAFDRPVLALFLGAGSEGVEIARHIQLLASWNFVFFGIVMVMTATMRAAGAVWVPLVILAISVFPIRLGFYYAAYDRLGADAIWYSFPASAFAALLIAWGFYAKWNWRSAAQPLSSGLAEECAHSDGLEAGRMKPDI